MGLQLKVQKKFLLNEEFNSCLMFSVMLVVLQLVTLNGLRILNTLDGVVFSENGKRNQRKIWLMLFKELLKVIKPDMISPEKNSLKEQLNVISFMVV